MIYECVGVSLTHAKHAFLFFPSLSLSPPIGSFDDIIEMQRPFLPLLLFLALCVGFTAAAVGKCADGSEGLTIAALKAGTASAATCVPATAFEYYSGDVELTGDDCKSLARIELFAFASMNGKVTIDCVLGKLEHVRAGAFLVGYGAGNAASSINLSGALLLEDIGVRAFQGFKGAIAISGAYPALTDIAGYAFRYASNPANSINIACSSPAGPLAVRNKAFDGYVGSHDASGEQTPCKICKNKICAAGQYRAGTCGANGKGYTCIDTTTSTTPTLTSTTATITTTSTTTTATTSTATATSTTATTTTAGTSRTATTATLTTGTKLNVGGGDAGSSDPAATAVATNSTIAGNGNGEGGASGTGASTSAVIIAVVVVAVLSLVGISVYCWKGRGTTEMAAAPAQLVVVNAGYPVAEESRA